MPECPRCQQVVAAGAERCEHCGAWITQASGDAGPKTAAGAKDGADHARGSLAERIRLLLGQGEKIAAIKLFREETGFGLAEAKDAVERLAGGAPLAASDQGQQPSFSDVSDAERPFVELLARGQKIGAIKLYREQRGVGLKEAKDAVEALAARHGLNVVQRGGCAGALVVMIAGALTIVFGWVRW